MSHSLTKKEAAQQQIQQQQQHAHDVETQEHHASANASVWPGLSHLLASAFDVMFRDVRVDSKVPLTH